jgi:hypothetical protein
MRIKNLLSILVLFSFLVSCNMPAVQVSIQPSEVVPTSSNPNAIGTAVELTAAARLTEIAASAPATFTSSPTSTPTLTFTPTNTPIPTQCTPLVTANVVANVRSGPDTAYDVIGSLAQGQTATVVGRNDAYTWWYIDYSGGHAWIAGSVTTSACVPAVVQVVAAPPLPTATATQKLLVQVQNLPNLKNVQIAKPDLVAAGMQYYTVSGKTVHVMVSVKNTGSADAGPFVVKWTANQDLGGCHWTMSKLAAGKSKDLECDYTYTWGATSYWSVLIVDSDGNVAESDEGNNTKDFKVDL